MTGRMLGGARPAGTDSHFVNPDLIRNPEM